MSPGSYVPPPLEPSESPAIARRAAAPTATVMLLALATLGLAQAFDLATFTVMVATHGPSAEANPLVSDLFDSFGMPAVVAVKFALILLVAALFVASSSYARGSLRGAVGSVPLALAITAGLIGGITNAASILG